MTLGVGILIYALAGLCVLAALDRDPTTAGPEDFIETLAAVMFWPLLLVAYLVSRRRP